MNKLKIIKYFINQRWFKNFKTRESLEKISKKENKKTN